MISCHWVKKATNAACQPVLLDLLSAMAAEHLPLLTSKDPSQRKEGLRNTLEAFGSCKDKASTNGQGLSGLLAAILHCDPSSDVRYMVLGHPLTSVDTLCDALQDSDSSVRKTAAEALCKRILPSDEATSFFPQFFSILALETQDLNIVTILQILQLMYIESPIAPEFDITLTALGRNEICNSVEDIYDVPIYYAVIRDVAESESVQARRALAPLLAAITKSASTPEEVLTQEGLHTLQLSFQILETLLQDLHRPVQMAAVDALHQVWTSSQHQDLVRTARFSDQSVKCVLRMAKLPVDRQVDDDTCRVLELLTMYPFATLSAYSLAERFLRVQWFKARVPNVQRDHDRANNIGILRSKLFGIMKSNPAFAQVIDLKRGLSDKSGWITPNQIQ